MAGKKNGVPAPRCDDTLKDASPCKNVAQAGESKCGSHLRKARERAEALAVVVEPEPGKEEISGSIRKSESGARTIREIPEESPEEALEEAVENVRVSDVRGQLAEDIANDYYLIRDSLLGGLKAEREQFVTCPKCSKRHPVPVADWNGRVNATKALLDQGLGKLKEATSAQLSEESLRVWAEGLNQRSIHDWTTDELNWYCLYEELVNPDREFYRDRDEILRIVSEASEADAVHKLLAVVERAKIRRLSEQDRENTVRFPTRPVPSVGDTAA